MSEDVIKVEVDDTELDIAIAKAKQLASIGTQITGTPKLSTGIKQIKQQTEDLVFTLTPVTDKLESMQYRLAQLGIDDLPGINRELRLILGQLPGARQAIQAYFRLKRLARGFDVGGWQMYVTLIATAIILLKAVMEHQRNIERRQQEYESFIRRERGLTKGEYDSLMVTWQSHFRSSPG